MEVQCDIIILAAGASARLGSPKQLIEFNGKSFLKNTIDTALSSLAQRVVVVIAANTENMRQDAEDERLHFTVNNEWQEGMASSIRNGIQYLLNSQSAPVNVLFMVCDQPYINSGLLDKLITLQRQTGKLIVASEYAGVTGIPAVFAGSLIPELMQLTGDTGARKLIQQHKEELAAVSFPLGSVDIDTKADLWNLQKKENRKNDH